MCSIAFEYTVLFAGRPNKNIGTVSFAYRPNKNMVLHCFLVTMTVLRRTYNVKKFRHGM